MSELLLVGGVLMLALVSAFVPVVSIEAVLLVAAATGTPRTLLAAQVAAAAVGQMAGKSCFFLGGRVAFDRWRGCRVGRADAVSRLATRAERRRAAAAATILVSATTGLPPFAFVSALAGTWRLPLPSFILLGLAGRSTRFGGVLLLPQLLV